MDVFFRKYFWLAELGFIAILSFFSASIANTYIESRLVSAPELPKSESSAVKTAVTDVTASLADAKKANIFKTPRQDLQGIDTSVDIKEPSGESLEPATSQIRAQLVGTMEADNPKNSLAVLVDTGTRTPALYGVGSVVMEDYKITKIERKKVTFMHGSRIEFLDMDEGKASMPKQAGGPSRDQTGSADGVKELSPGKYVVAQSELDSTLTNINQVAMQARIQPNIENGKSNGFKLFSIKPGSIYSKIGLQNGDVVQKINGFEMNSPDKALEIYGKLKEAKHLNIEINRNGKPMSMDYTIR